MTKNERQEYRMYILDINDAISDIEEFVKSIAYENFIKDKRIIKAVAKNLEIISKASEKIPDSIKNKYSNVPWKKISAINFQAADEIWKVATEDMPRFKPIIELMADKEDKI